MVSLKLVKRIVTASIMISFTILVKVSLLNSYFHVKIIKVSQVFVWMTKKIYVNMISNQICVWKEKFLLVLIVMIVKVVTIFLKLV